MSTKTEAASAGTVPITPASKGGRPSKGLSESSQLIRAPKSLLEQVNAAAEEEGISASEWWRQAALQRLALVTK